MEIDIGRGKKGRRAYGLDEIAIVPSRRTRDPEDVDLSWRLDGHTFDIPLLASAMDGVVDTRSAGIMGKLGGLAVLNLEGIQTRYEEADAELERIAGLPVEEATRGLQADLPRAGQARADRPADQGDQGPGRRRRRVPDAAAGDRLRGRRPRGGPRRPGHPGDRGLRRARLVGRRAAQPQALHLRAAGAGDRRRLRLVPHGPPPHAHRRGGRARRASARARRARPGR